MAIFSVKVDFLPGESEYAFYKKETDNRIKNIQKIDDNTKRILLNLIDSYMQNFKTKQAFAK